MKYFERAGDMKAITYARALLYQLVKCDPPMIACRESTGDPHGTMAMLSTIIMEYYNFKYGGSQDKLLK
jgi:hypothetical protein